MSILARFTSAPSMNAKKYDDVMPKIEASGPWPPDGMQYHVAFEADGVFRVSEIWESEAKFEAFGQRLMPILQEAGIELAGPPSPQHRQAVGTAAPLGRWEQAAARFAALDDDPQGAACTVGVGDAHEADVRDALSACPVPDDAVRSVLKVHSPAADER